MPWYLPARLVQDGSGHLFQRPAGTLARPSRDTNRASSSTHDRGRNAGLWVVLLIALGSPGCREPGTNIPLEIQLEEVSNVPIDGSQGVLRDVGDVVPLADSTFVVLDRQSRRLHHLSSGGIALATKRFFPLRDRQMASLLAAGPAGTLLLTSSDGTDCAWYSMDLERLERDCEWGVPLVHRRDILGTSEGFLVVARLDGSRDGLHLVSADLRTLEGSGGETATIANPQDSVTLNWGVGVAGLDPSNLVWYAAYNPLVLSSFTGRLRPRDRWALEGGMRPAAEFVGEAGHGQTLTINLIERTTGLIAFDGLLLHVSYFPLEDVTHLRVFNKDGVLRATASLRFRFDVRGVTADGTLIAVRHLDPPSVGLYQPHLQNRAVR